MDEALDWYVRLQGPGGDPETRARFEEWRAGDRRRRDAYARLTAVWAMPELVEASRIDAARLGMTAPVDSADGTFKRKPVHWTRRVAAAAAVVLIAVGLYQLPTIMLHWQADYVTATGSRQQIQLPDGSIATLNTASAISIDFENGLRSVTLLEGEAYFDVVHDPGRPFRVAGHFGEVEVRGTAFAVRTDDEKDHVVLERGVVEVSRLSDRQDRALLDPNQMVSATATRLSAVTAVDPRQTLAWLKGRIRFSNQPLANVLNNLRRYYDGSVVIADSRVGRLRVSGNYRLDNPEGAIRSLAEAAGAETTRLPGGILILH